MYIIVIVGAYGEFLDVKLHISTAVDEAKSHMHPVKNVSDTQKAMCRWLLERQLKELVGSTVSS